MSNLSNEKTKSIVGVSIHTTNQDAANTIPALWGRFYSEGVASKISDKISDDVYAVYSEFENEGKSNEGEYKFLIGVEVPSDADVEADLDVSTIPVGNYHRFEVPEKSAEQVFPTWQKIWLKDDIGKSFLCDYELYAADGEISINVGTTQTH